MLEVGRRWEVGNTSQLNQENILNGRFKEFRNLQCQPQSGTTDQGKENIHALLTSILDSTREDLLRSVQARAYSLEQGAAPISQKATLKRVISRVPVSRAEEFSERIHNLLKEFDESDRSTAAGGEQLQPYALTVAFYPSFFYKEEKGEGNKGEE